MATDERLKTLLNSASQGTRPGDKSQIVGLCHRCQLHKKITCPLWIIRSEVKAAVYDCTRFREHGNIDGAD